MKNIKTRAIELDQDLRDALHHIAEIEKVYRRGSLYSMQPPQPLVKDIYAFYCLAGIDGRFELDEQLIVQHERQSAEDQHNDCRDHRHHRNVARHNVGNRERRQDCHHESAGSGKDAELRIRSKEKDERPDVEHQLEDGIELFLLCGHDVLNRPVLP